MGIIENKNKVIACLKSPRSNFLRWCSGLFLFFFTATAFSQTYPVTATTILVPPFSGFLQDYANAGNPKLKLLLTFNDFTKPSYDIKIKFRLTGQNVTIQSKPYYYYGPVTLIPGVPLEISGDELAQILNDNNLSFSGINYSTYQSGKVLPEGFYSFCFTVYDNDNPLAIPVSQEACAFVWMTHCDPPFLNLPLCNSVVPVSSPQQITFNWTCNNAGCPSSIANTEYDFELYEIFPAGQNPNNIIQTSAPIYTATIQQTLMNYGITEPPLQFGREYCWRVKARDANGYDYFKNNGWSNVCVFSYGSSSAAAAGSIQLSLAAQAIRYNTAKFGWSPNSSLASYRVEYRKTGNSSFSWFGMNTTHSSVVASDLEAQTQYEARLRGVLPGGDTTAWSAIETFTTPAQPVINCDDPSVAPSMQNFSPLTTLQPQTQLQIGQFEMRVTSLQSISSSNGMYSGAGHIVMLGGLAIHVTFSNILVGSDYVVYQGEVKAVTEGVNAWLSQQNSIFDADYNYNGTADSVYLNNNGVIVIVSSTGDTTHVDPPGLPYTIVDSDGTMYIVNADGTVTIVNGVPHIEMTSEQKSVYVLAMKLLKEENSNSKISDLKSELAAKSSAYNNHLQQTYGFRYEGTPPPANNGRGVLIEIQSEEEEEGAGVNSPENDYLEAECNYLAAKVCRAWAKDNLDAKDLDFLAEYLLVEEKKSFEYIDSKLKSGVAAATIAEAVKNGLHNYVKKVLTAKIYKSN